MKFVKKFLIALIIAVPTGICLALFVFMTVDSIEPTAPIPVGGIRVSHHSHAASHGLWYYEKYVVNLPPEQVLAFYQGIGATCKVNQESNFSVNAPFYECLGSASPRGGFYVQFKRQSEATTSMYTSPSRREFLALPEQPEKDDPIGETLILVTVRWEQTLD